MWRLTSVWGGWYMASNTKDRHLGMYQWRIQVYRRGGDNSIFYHTFWKTQLSVWEWRPLDPLMCMSVCYTCHVVFLVKSSTKWGLMEVKNKNAFQWDAYRPLQFPSRGGGGLPRGVCVCVCPEGDVCLGMSVSV